jgi:RNA polymerase sigma-70 factor (ECF subfamily)
MTVTMSRSEVYERHAGELVRFATGLVGPSDGPDLVSSAMVKVLWSPSWPAVRNPRAYLYKAVLNEARRFKGGGARRRLAEARSVGDSRNPGIPEVRPDVVEAVSRLSLRQRAVVFLAYWEDLTPAEIARRLELSEGTVHRHLTRAESRLRRVLHE